MSARLFKGCAAALLLSLVAACGGGGSATGSGSVSLGGTTSSGPEAAEPLSDRALLGQKIFRDASLSASGQLACISCHDPATGHASPFDTPVAMGGPLMDQAGRRNPPTLRYLRFNTLFHFEPDGTPMGGFFWDGRVSTLADQARGPLLNPLEMANPDVASVVARLANASYAPQFRAVFGDDIFTKPEAAMHAATIALEFYQRQDPDFAPFDSKFDAFTAGRTTLTPQELNGLALFNRADKGNCAACHSSTAPVNAPGALFTDFTYDNIGVPRNAGIAANADASYRDGGLCESGRPELAARADLCGAFKVPTLRNVALRKHFFHNGAFSSLEDVIRFYATRDTNPEMWYSTDALGNITPYDDLRASERANVNTTEGPYNRKRGEAPALTEDEIQDIAAFLRTLNDGWSGP